MTDIQAQQQVIYATLGPEAPAILRGFVDPATVMQIQPGTMGVVLANQHVDYLLAPQGWSAQGDLDAARQAKLPITLLKRHLTIKDITDNIATVAFLTQQAEHGRKWIEDINQGVANVQSRVRDLPVTRVLILSPEFYTQGQGALITELITVAGGINVAAEAGLPEARQISDQQLRDFAPDVILLQGCGWTPASIAEFSLNPLYHRIPAFDNLRIHVLDSIGKDPLHLVNEVTALSEILHPSIF